MTRISRTRSRDVSISGTLTDYVDGVITGGPDVRTRSDTCTCEDFHGRPIVPSPFSSEQIQPGLRLTGTAKDFHPFFSRSYARVFNGYPIDPNPAGITTSMLGVSGGWYLNVVARTNPSRPVLTPATLIQDFVELPSMIRDVGRLLMKPKRLLTAKELANQDLAVSFGWVPLVRDLKQILDLQSAVQKRVAELRRLYSGKGLRRKVVIQQDEQTSLFTAASTYGPGARVNYGFNVNMTRKQWATITWKPSVLPPSSIQDEEMHQLARKVVLGLTPEGLSRGVWDVLPWTWLLGWFSNVGDFMLSNSNTVPATHSEACLMNERRVTYVPIPVTYTGGVSPNGDVTMGPSRTWVTKTRTVSGFLTPGFNVPFVDTFRLSILGSLFVQRFLR